jgi:hypothetical protein
MSSGEKEHFSLKNFGFFPKLYFSLGNFFYSIGNLFGTSI